MTLKTDYVLDRLLEAERHISDAEKVLWKLEGQVKDFNALTITLLASNVGADWREKLAKIRERLEKEKERMEPFWMPLDDRPVSPTKEEN